MTRAACCPPRVETLAASRRLASHRLSRASRSLSPSSLLSSSVGSMPLSLPIAASTVSHEKLTCIEKASFTESHVVIDNARLLLLPVPLLLLLVAAAAGCCWLLLLALLLLLRRAASLVQVGRIGCVYARARPSTGGQSEREFATTARMIPRTNGQKLEAIQA